MLEVLLQFIAALHDRETKYSGEVEIDILNMSEFDNHFAKRLFGTTQAEHKR